MDDNNQQTVEYEQVRERFFREIHDHPENYEMILHNATHLLFNYVRWPEEFTDEQKATFIRSFWIELRIRREFAIEKRRN